MNNSDLLGKARTAKDWKELFEMAQEAEYPITEEDAQKIFEQLHTSAVLSDDELDDVAGGCGDSKYPPVFKVGQIVTNAQGKTCNQITNPQSYCSCRKFKITRIEKCGAYWYYSLSCCSCYRRIDNQIAQNLKLC